MLLSPYTSHIAWLFIDHFCSFQARSLDCSFSKDSNYEIRFSQIEKMKNEMLVYNDENLLM